eukprot:TRINITY_DN8870_c0_g1_i8.p1 TRINITY_DN8870_c0_g1~~TRINITY_DN8870_c0_g1_i8.p1  ORF type:complete len:105 (+),score=11.46 TRINITY_DN8870_c0_g1_i8:224-538(+)
MDLCNGNGVSVFIAMTVLLMAVSEASHRDQVWQEAHATYFGDSDALGTMGKYSAPDLKCKLSCFFGVFSRLTMESPGFASVREINFRIDILLVRKTPGFRLREK